MHSSMVPLVRMAGVKEEDIPLVMPGINTLPLDELLTFNAWLTGISNGLYANALAIWSLREPQYWANLKMMGEYKLREQVSLKAALEPLRKSWRRKSGSQKKTSVHVNNPKPPQGECGQPEN